jgi:predicted transcriptional regulator
MEDSCGRWLPHQLFRTPGHILAQAASLEEGQKLFTIARTSMAPLTQIGLGCQVCECQNYQHHALTHILKHHKLEQNKNICHLTKG